MGRGGIRLLFNKWERKKNIFSLFFVRFIGVDLFFNDVNIRCGATTF